MNKIETFQQFLATEGVEINVWGFLFNLFLAAILGHLLARLYVRFGNSLSNRELFARNFVLLSVTTMIIIMVVKSSLALSLGLVGALSIVRFRAAIKEPEELAYIFLTISFGLGLGADQRLITLVGFCFVAGLIALKSYMEKGKNNQQIHLTVSSYSPTEVSLDKIVSVLERHCSSVNLRRLDESEEVIESAFSVGFADFKQLNKTQSDLRGIHPSVRVNLLDNQGIL